MAGSGSTSARTRRRWGTTTRPPSVSPAGAGYRADLERGPPSGRPGRLSRITRSTSTRSTYHEVDQPGGSQLMGVWVDETRIERPRRLVIVVRADPVICGHSGEARNLAEAALQRGFGEVRIVTWPLDLLASLGPAAQTAGRRTAVQRGDRGRAAGTGRRLQGARRSLSGRDDRPAGRAVHRRRADGLHVALPEPAHASPSPRRSGSPGPPVCRSGHHDRRGRRVRRHQRRPLLRGRRAVRRGRPRALGVPGQRRAGRGLGVHPAADHLLGRARSTPGTAPRSPTGAGSGWRSPTRRSTPPTTSISTPASRRPHSSDAAWSPTATCCTCPGWRTPRGSTT